MRIYMVAFSEKGRALAEKIQNISLSVDYGNVPCEGKKVQEKTIVYLREKEPLDVWVDLAFMQGMPLVFIGAAGLIIVVLIPIFFNGVFGASVSFGGTSIIIIVGVILETLKQIESQMLVRNYKGFLSE